MSTELDRLLDLLDLEQIELNIFRGRSPKEWVQRVFGGQVAGQALVAAGRTVPSDRPVHSLHAYFIRPGDPAVPIVYTVDRVRDGRSFTTRRVGAHQRGDGRPVPASGSPAAPPPGGLEPTSLRLRRVVGEAGSQPFSHPFDLRS